ncbi:hypothetical protein B0T13DRAFT_539706 [Neurospora crassa]|nr:hypothetical protein B0T13DRAFT_539706 [Neurospora crassa]
MWIFFSFPILLFFHRRTFAKQGPPYHLVFSQTTARGRDSSSILVKIFHTGNFAEIGKSRLSPSAEQQTPSCAGNITRETLCEIDLSSISLPGPLITTIFKFCSQSGGQPSGAECYKCGEVGHNARNCSMDGQEFEVAESVLTRPLTDRAGHATVGILPLTTPFVLCPEKQTIYSELSDLGQHGFISNSSMGSYRPSVSRSLLDNPSPKGAIRISVIWG